MTDATAKAAASSYFEKVLNRGDMTAAGEIFHRDVQFHYPLGDLNGVDQVKHYIDAVRTAFPDIHFTTLDLIGEGNRIVIRWSLAGSRTGEFRGNPATGNQVKVPGITIFHIANGKIREMRIVFDPALLL
jgi:steroid delta-isomerase-like uncharacterized protein